MGTIDESGLPVRAYRIHISYDGTDFAGWQVQPGQRTVQGEIEKALGAILGEEVRLHGSGRTDAGVHALEQVAHFRCAASKLNGAVIERALPGRLPPDIALRRLEEAPDSFDARRCAVGRSYRYRIIRRRDPFARRFAWEVRGALDVEKMIRAAVHFTGEHDFTSFAASTRKGMDNRVVVKSASIAAGGEEIRFDVTANRFIHRMVRNMAGTLVEVGRGRIEPDRILGILAGRDRTLAGIAAPAHGLCLVHVAYRHDTGASGAGGKGDGNEVLSRHG